MAAKQSFSSKGVRSGAGTDDDRTRDLQLARFACDGEQAAWNALYLQYHSFLLWLARERLKLPSEQSADIGSGVRTDVITAEEFAHEVYVIVWDKKKCCSYEGRAPFRYWYQTVVTRIYHDLYRQRRKNYPPGRRVPLESEDDE